MTDPYSQLQVSTINRPKQSHFFAVESDGTGDDLDRFIAAVTSIAQFQCKHATDYNDIETLICRLPIDQLTFAAHDSSAPYSGPYPMALLVRAYLIEGINGWDETDLHDYLRANPVLPSSLLCGLFGIALRWGLYRPLSSVRVGSRSAVG